MINERKYLLAVSKKIKALEDDVLKIAMNEGKEFKEKRKIKNVLNLFLNL